MNELLQSHAGANAGPVECLGTTFPSEAARREHFLNLLAEKLKDPGFRTQEGFPSGTDAAILAMSDPPYYTACPNPWLTDFVTHCGRPYDHSKEYRREPMAIDVSIGKSDPVYKAHSYHTKVPHLAIVPSILHFTEPGDIVLDGFAGSGMTGITEHYADLPSLPAAKGPVMVHHVPRFLSLRRTAGEDRIALLVFDGLAMDQWLQIRSGLCEMHELNELIESSHSGDAAKKKTRTVLNRLWLEPRPELVDFADRGVQIYRDAPDTSVTVLGWGMAIATYPFFGRVAEIVGRLTALQGDCASAEVHRRMSELFGEREGTRRMTNMVLQSQASWGAIERIKNGTRLVRKPKIDVGGNLMTAWLVEACLRYAGRPIPLPALEFLPVIFPFKINDQVTHAISKSPAFELRTEGHNKQIIDLKLTCNS